MATNNPFTSAISNAEFHPELLQIHKTNSGSLSSFSSNDGMDLISFEDGGTCATELSSRPPSSTSFLLDDSLGPSSTHSSKPTKSIYVTISGTSFSVPQDAFDKLNKLNWMRDGNGNWKLRTSPAIFEILLGYVLFETLPAIDTLSKAEYNEFEPMALSLGLHELVEHFDRSSDKRLRSRQRRTSLKKKHKGTPIVLNSDNVSHTTVRLAAANNRCARFVASLKLKAPNRLRARRTKTTHDQWCASDLVN